MQSENPVPKQSVNGLTDQIRNFKAISSPFLQKLIPVLPAALILLLLADWLIGVGAFANDFFRLTSVLATTIELFVLTQLFRRIPEALEVVWARNLLIDSKENESLETAFDKYLKAFEATLNSHWAIAVGVVGLVAGLISTYPVRFFIENRVSPFPTDQLIVYYLWGNAGFAAPLLGYVAGLLVWRACVIAAYIHQLGTRFSIRIQPNHPDQCGGLKPIGNLCLIIALLLLIPAIFFSGWAFASTFVEGSSPIYDDLWADWFKQWLVVLSGLSVFAFLWPLYTIHQQMQKQRLEIQAELDELAQRIDTLSKELRTQAYQMTSEQGGERLKSLEFMETVYKGNAQIPVWPVDWPTVITFSSAQVLLPLLSFLGTSDTVIKFINSFINLTPK